MAYPERKTRLLTAFLDAFTRFDQAIVVGLINISTEQIIKTRMSLRTENGIILIGKNTIAKLAIRILTTPDDPNADYFPYQQKYGKRPQLAALLPHVVGKIGFVFCEKSYVDVRPMIEKESVRMPAKAGALAPSDVWIMAGPTSIDPGRIGDFQRLGISTKTAKLAIEIIKDFKLCSKGDIVSETVAAMCKMLNIIPFQYAMALELVYLNGHIIPQEVIQINPSDVDEAIARNLQAVAALSLEAGLPNALSVPHMIMGAFKNVLALGLAADLKFEALEKALSSQASAPAPGQAQAGGAKDTGAKAAAPKEEVKEEEPEDVDMDMGDLFG